MYYIETGTQGTNTPPSPSVRALDRLRSQATVVNLIGLLCAFFLLGCLLFLHEPWNLRIPLYLIVAIWAILRPRVALYLMPIAVPWGSVDTITLIGANLNSADILVGLLAVGWLLSFVLRPVLPHSDIANTVLDREEHTVPRYLIVSVVILLIAMLISMTGAYSVRTSLKELAKWIELLIVILIGSQYFRTRRQIWTLVVVLCLAAISQAIYGYIQYFFDIGPQAFIRDASLRVYGTFGQPNPYAGYINMTLMVALAPALLGGKAKTRILAAITAALLLAAEIFSQSRGGEIAMAVGLLVILVIGVPLIRKLAAIGVVGALLITAGFLAGKVTQKLVNPVINILGLKKISFTAPSPQDYSTAERLAHWIAGINMFLTHPILGVGIGNYPDAYTQYYITIFVNSLGHAHNYYINIAAETGIIGLFAFLTFLATMFIMGGSAYRAIHHKYRQVKAQQGMERRMVVPPVGTRQKLYLLLHPPQLTQYYRSQSGQATLFELTNDRALAIGLLASLLTVCVHNLVDDLYVHSMTNLIALLLIALIRLEAVKARPDDDATE